MQAVFAGLEDYTRGSLGPVGQIPAHMVDYYRAAETARREWCERMELAES